MILARRTESVNEAVILLLHAPGQSDTSNPSYTKMSAIKISFKNKILIADILVLEG